MLIFLVPCPPLGNLTNGKLNCGDDGVLYNGTICNFTCNYGYHLFGNDSTTCQNNGEWSINHTDTTCVEGTM